MDVTDRRKRSRICGLETEYAVLYEPDDPADTRRPEFPVIEKILFDALLEGRCAAPSLEFKSGYFLQNGGLAHLELYLHTQEDTPILELSTPECSSSRDLLRYQRACDVLLTQAGRRCAAALAARGHAGRIIFGKNNLDSKGAGHGCHENYLVESPLSLRGRLLLLLAVPFLLALSLPWVVLIAAFFSLFFLAVAGLFAGALMASFFNLMHPEFAERTAARLRELSRADRMPARIVRGAVRACVSAANLGRWVPVASYAAVFRLVAFRPFVQDLTAFLVTRPMLAGSGRFDPRTGAFELSQRAPLTTSVAWIVFFLRHKTMYDLKGLLFRPFSVLRSAQRMTLCLGDSNLSDCSNYLKIGVTALILDMIEAGERFEDLRVARPVRAFREVSCAGPWKEIALAGGNRMTAIDIQRAYLRRARSFFAERDPGDEETRELLDLWEETLGLIADDPPALATRLDWAAKKMLLDRAVLARSNWKELGTWARVFHVAGDEALRRASALGGLAPRCSFLRARAVRRRVEACRLDPGRFEPMRELYFQCRKLDLRFHEIGAAPGYQRQLEKEGLIDRLTDDESVERAIDRPPPDTRARVRGYYIERQRQAGRWGMQVGWDRVFFPGTATSISLADPYGCRIPTD